MERIAIKPRKTTTVDANTVSEEKHSKGGRPTKYKPEYCDKVIEWGKQGCSKAQMACKLLIAEETLYDWARTNTVFSESLMAATTFAQAVWEDKADAGIKLETKEFNAGLYKMVMAARFPKTYREQTVVKHGGLEGGLPIPLSGEITVRRYTPEEAENNYKKLIDGV